MTSISLQQVMNDMAARPEMVRQVISVASEKKPLGELEAFIQMDGTLAQLNKDYLEAKAQRLELCKLYGHDDAMVEVAMDMEDSAWCAMQTRYLELRAERQLMEQAQRLIRQSERRIANQKASEEAFAAQQFAYFMRMLEKIKEMNKTPRIFEWAFLLILFKLAPFDQKPNFAPQSAAA